MTLTVGSLCTGTAAVELALAQVLGAEPLWFADPDPGAVALLAHRYPDTPNLGDLTKVDWRAIRRPDIIAVGFPCQDISAAGLRAGMRPGNRSGLWFHIVYVIAEMRPMIVVIENVRALLTARGAPPTPELIAAWAELERYARVLTLIEAKLNRAMKRDQRDRTQRLQADRVRIMGRHRGAVGAVKRADARIVRALGTVLGDLADLGFDAEWVMLPASGVDAPHQRNRVFIVAAAADTGRGGVQRWADDRGIPGSQGEGAGEGLQRQRGRDTVGDAGAAAADAAEPGRGEAGWERPGAGAAPTGRGPAEPGRLGGAAADTAREGLEGLARSGRPAAGVRRRPAEAAGPTDERCEHCGHEHAQHYRGGYCADCPGESCDEWEPPVVEIAADPEGDGRGEGRPEPIREGQTGAVGDRGGTAPDADLADLDDLEQVILDWADYAPAIERWERVLGRAAPAPTVLGTRGARRLSPRFVEWMMGLPAGWVTEVPGITRNQMLKMLGNGVVTQQAAAALTHLLPLLLADLAAA